MSVSLDLACYLRKHRIKKLSLAHRGVLYTMMFRIGSNPFSWITQTELADEMDVTDRTIRKYLDDLVTWGFLLSKPDPKDKRRNLYAPAKFLINYHQNKYNAKQKEKIDYQYPTKPKKNIRKKSNISNDEKSNNDQQKYRKDPSGISENSGKILPVISGKILPVFHEKKSLQLVENNNKNDESIGAERNIESKSVYKAKAENSYLNGENGKKYLDEIRQKLGRKFSAKGDRNHD